MAVKTTGGRSKAKAAAKGGGGAKAKKAVRATAKAAGPKVPTAAELADFAGVKLQPSLRPKAAQQLLKPLPGYRAIMDNVAAYLGEDNDVLKLKYAPSDILTHLANAKDLSARATVLQQVWAGVDGARQSEDGYLMKVLLDAVKRVREQSGAHPDLLVKWAEVLEFVKKYRPGKSAQATATATGTGTPATS